MFVRKSTYDRMRVWADRNQEAFLQASAKLYTERASNARLLEALRAILDNKTARPNATVARIIQIAEDALTEEESNGASTNDNSNCTN